MPAKLCPKHSKPFPCGPCRKESAAKPAQAPATLTVPVPVAQVEPLPVIKRRGRPAKNGAAMTPAERKARSRADQKMKLDDLERRSVIAALMKVHDRQTSNVIVIGRDRDAVKRAEERRAVDRLQKRNYLIALKNLSLADLRIALEGKSTPDTLGRLRNERSGEGERSMGQSEIEQIDAAMQHDASNFGDDYEQDPNLAAGYKVLPTGPGADASEQDSDADSADIRTGVGKPGHQETAADKWIAKLVSQIQFAEKQKCPYCFDAFVSSAGMRGHLEEQYAKGEIDLERLHEQVDATAAFNTKYEGLMPNLLGVLTEPITRAYVHYKLINRDMKAGIS